MGYYPLFLEMHQRRCVIVGGGAVAERKAEALLAVGASVTVISPTITDRLRQLTTKGAIHHVRHEYEAGDLAGHDLIFVATDNSDINAAVYLEARSRGIWINAADDPDHCDFILPAVIRRGDLAVAVSTGGASPAVARAIREDLETYFTADHVTLVQIAAEVRRELREKSVSANADAWNKALRGNFRRLIEEGKPQQAKKLLLSALGAES